MVQKDDFTLLRSFPNYWPLHSFSRTNLIKVRAMAIRRGIWFRALSRAERAQIDLTIKLVERVRSSFLSRVLDSILRKLFEAMESRVWRLMRDVGVHLAKNLGEIAKGWGYRSALSWACDLGFIQFLAVNYLSASGLYKV